MFNLISNTYKSPRMNNAGAKQLHSGLASVIYILLLCRLDWTFDVTFDAN